MNGEQQPPSGCGVGDFEYFGEDFEEEMSFWKRKRRQVRHAFNRYHRRARHAIINA